MPAPRFELTRTQAPSKRGFETREVVEPSEQAPVLDITQPDNQEPFTPGYPASPTESYSREQVPQTSAVADVAPKPAAAETRLKITDFLSRLTRILRIRRFELQSTEHQRVKIYLDRAYTPEHPTYQIYLQAVREFLDFLPTQLVEKLNAIYFVKENPGTTRGKYESYSKTIYINVPEKGQIDDNAKYVASITIIHEMMHLLNDPVESNPFFLPSVVTKFGKYLSQGNPWGRIFTRLFTKQELKQWQEISRAAGDYLDLFDFIFYSVYRFIRPKAMKNRLRSKPNFGFAYNCTTDWRYGAFHFEEDVACCCSHLLYTIHLVLVQDESEIKECLEKQIKELLEPTPNEIGLMKKYRIACEAMARVFEERYSGRSSEEKHRVHTLVQLLQQASEIIGERINLSETKNQMS